MTEQIFPLGQLCNADKSARIKFVIQDREGARIYNEAETSIDQLLSGNTQLAAGNGCTMTVGNLQVFVRPTLVDYLRSGWSISMVGAIDYTASNGEPSNPNSLHFMGGNN